MMLVVVVYRRLSLVLVGVGNVIVLVRMPERIVGGGIVDVAVAVNRTDSMVVIAGAVAVVDVVTAVAKIAVVVGASGARRSSRPSCRLCFAASIRARAHS